MTQPTGRRERKKVATRRALADAALHLFSERGFDNVGVREVANAADVALSTLFTYFPSKESLVFDLDHDLERGLVNAVWNRPPEQSVLHALRDYLIELHATTRHAVANDTVLRTLIRDTPALQDYAQHMWQRHEAALTEILTEAAGMAPDDLACAALARFTLHAANLADQRTNPETELRQIFDLLESGWNTTPVAHTPRTE